MDNIKNKNKSISDKPNKFNLPKTLDNRQCIAPCYPPGSLFYHPIYLVPYKDDVGGYFCPTIKYFNEKTDRYEGVGICKPEDVDEQYKYFDIFDDVLRLASTDELFLHQIYDINNIYSATQFINDSMETMPVYTQKRILNCIFNVWQNDPNFPYFIFCQKVSYVLKSIYNVNLDPEKIKNKIINIKKQKYNDIFNYLSKKYSNKKSSKK
jgi:hypothetical protein